MKKVCKSYGVKGSVELLPPPSPPPSPRPPPKKVPGALVLSNEEEVKVSFGNAIGPYIDLLTSVERRKLKWYGHVTRSSGQIKAILQGTVQGGRRRDRQRKRWEDNVKERTGLEWNIILGKAENREEWRKLVVNYTVVTQRSARLRNR